MIVTYAYSQETWIKFQDKVGNFSILMPNKPKKDVDLLESPQGIKIKLISFISFIKNNSVMYMVSYTDYPIEVINSLNTDEFLSSSTQGAANNVNGVVIVEQKITLNGYPGREVVIEAAMRKPKDATFKTRFYLIKNRLYVIQIYSLKGLISAYEQNNFLNSFKYGKS